jgi:hypothetical protein
MDDEKQKPLDPKMFRNELDAVLRRRNSAALRDFLVERGQWATDTTTDPETAMWMMVAGSPALSDLHEEAAAWLRAHGHAAEAEAILGGRQVRDSAARSPERPMPHKGVPRLQDGPRRPDHRSRD